MGRDLGEFIRSDRSMKKRIDVGHEDYFVSGLKAFVLNEGNKGCITAASHHIYVRPKLMT